MAGMATSFTDQLRGAICDSGRTRYELWKATGIDQATLSRFVAGKAGLSLRAVDALVSELGLELRRVDKGRGNRGDRL
jgi:hypothetical protein